MKQLFYLLEYQQRATPLQFLMMQVCRGPGLNPWPPVPGTLQGSVKDTICKSCEILTLYLLFAYL